MKSTKVLEQDLAQGSRCLPRSWLNNLSSMMKIMPQVGHVVTQLITSFHHIQTFESLVFAGCQTKSGAGDPISGFQLQSADYLLVGSDIASAGLPTAFVSEGGYAVAQVGANVVNVLDGFSQSAARQAGQFSNLSSK